MPDNTRRIGMNDYEASGGFRSSRNVASSRTSRQSRKSSIFGYNESVRRVSVIIREAEDEPPETFTFDLGDPIHDEETSVGRFRNKVGAFINSNVMQTIMTCLIVGNAILLGVLTFDFAKEPNMMGPLNNLDIAFLSSFTLELVCQIIYLGPLLFKNNWLNFDFFIVVFSWAFMGSSTSVLRSFRIFRVFALISKWESLQDLWYGMTITVPKLLSIWAVLGLFFYVFMVLTVGLYGDLWEEGYFPWPYFSDLEQAFVTLFQIMTLDSWHDVVRGTMEKYYASYLLFYFFVSVTTFIFLNLMIAVVCEALIEIKTEQAEDEEGADKDKSPTSEIEDIVRDQAELIKAQREMKKTLELIITRLEK